MANRDVTKAPYAVGNLTNVIFVLSSIADSGTNDDISIDEAKQHIEAGDLWDYIGKIGGKGYLSYEILSEPHWAEFRAWYLEGMQSQKRSMDGRERRKYGIENRGLCLLISYTAEIIQEGKDLVFK